LKSCWGREHAEEGEIRTGESRKTYFGVISPRADFDPIAGGRKTRRKPVCQGKKDTPGEARVATEREEGEGRRT